MKRLIFMGLLLLLTACATPQYIYHVSAFAISQNKEWESIEFVDAIIYTPVPIDDKDTIESVRRSLAEKCKTKPDASNITILSLNKLSG